jgi:hypothetical protein
MDKNYFIRFFSRAIFSAAFYFLMMPVSYGQEIEWQNTIGGSNTDYLFSIQQTTDGGYILGGWSSSNISGDKTENGNGGDDYWIVKTDAAGNILWQNTIGGDTTDFLYSVQQTADGGYILGGYSTSNISGDKTENTNGIQDYWIIKTDAIGNIQWQNTIGGGSQDFLNCIKQTADGGYILGGSSNSGISGDKTENSNGLTDYWIIKTNAAGNIQWQNNIGGSGGDFIASVQQTADGGYILGGYSNSGISGDKTETLYGFYDYWIVKTDATGNIQWQNTIGGTNSDMLYSIQQTIDGGYILGGLSNSGISADKSENSLGNYDYWIVKTDATGNIQWENTIGGNYDDYLLSIQQTSDGGYILGGRSLSNFSGDKTENCVGGPDYWIVKTDDLGRIQWQNTIGGNSSEEPRSIQQTADGRYILGGYSLSNISGDKTENCLGNNDFWILKLTGNYNLITGKLFADVNSNNVQDVGEQRISNKKITESNTGRFAFSAIAGIYYVSVLDTGNFSVSPAAINYYNAVPSSQPAYFSGNQQTDSLNDFAFQPAGVFNDLCVTISLLIPLRAGFNASYMVNYENVGTTTLSPTVIFFPDNNATYVSASPAANSVTTDSVVWNFGPLLPYQTGSIIVTTNINIGTPIGTQVYADVRIEPIIGDADTVCNRDSWKEFTIGSFDPNEILVSRDTVFTTELSSPPFLNYIIYFQNTGNDTAFNVNILNPIDTSRLQLSTLEFVASSHPMNMQWLPWERNMEFKFDNILLPDSNVDEPNSHGFVRYKIKPKTTLTTADTVKNTAYIYFDFNAPVQTNTALTRIVLPTSVNNYSANENGFSVFPNPSSGSFTVKCKMPNAECRIVDLAGRAVFSQKLNNRSTIINHQFSPGIYFVELRTDENVKTQKLVIE